MKYYLAKIDCYDYFRNTQIFSGELLTENEVRKARFTPKDIRQLFIKVETSKNNTYRMFGVRKVIKYSEVKEWQ